MSLSSDLLDRLDKMLVYRQREMRAPHKPLYLLFCIASIQHGLPQLQSFEVVNQALTKALRRFGPRTQTVHPEYPFWRLQRDNLAKVTMQGELEYRKSNSDPTKSSLLKANARGGLRDEDYALLNSDAALQSLVVHKILDSHFPPSIHDEIIRHFDLILCDPHARDESTEMGFRKNVVLWDFAWKQVLANQTVRGIYGHRLADEGARTEYVNTLTRRLLRECYKNQQVR